MPTGTGPFRNYLRKWFVISAVIGILTGLTAVVLNFLIRDVFLGGLLGEGAGPGISLSLYSISPLFSFVLPFVGLTLTGLVLMKFTSSPTTSGTDEVLEHYHFSGTPLSVPEGFAKGICSILTIGLGGSAGLEGPSINSGGVIASWLWNRMKTRFGLTKEDLRVALLAGAAAGIAAIFKAPLTGIVFALEVPYKDDFARRAFMPAMISGVFSYVMFGSIVGFQPLFSFPTATPFTALDLGLTAILGLVIALLSVAFAAFFHRIRGLMRDMKLSIIKTTMIGGAVVGAVALIVRLSLAQPYTYGAGYGLIEESLLGQYGLPFLAAMLVLRFMATAFTLGTGGVGGIFFPQVLFGALTGSLFGTLVHGPVPLFASVGIAAFMSASYKTPLAAVTFVGDTTGSVSYLVPAMIASAIAYVVSGESSVSTEQTVWEEPPSKRPEWGIPQDE